MNKLLLPHNFFLAPNIYFCLWTINAPYLDGIRTHRGKVKSVIRPPLYLQATTAGFFIILLAPFLLWPDKHNINI